MISQTASIIVVRYLMNQISVCFFLYAINTNCFYVWEGFQWVERFIFDVPFQGFLYAIGGNDGTASLDTCERYDPHLNKWNMIATMNKRRAGSGVAELNGYLYVVGKNKNGSRQERPQEGLITLGISFC